MSKSDKFLPLNRRWFLRGLAFTGGAALFSNLTQFSSLARAKTKVAAANSAMKPYQQMGLYKDAISYAGAVGNRA